MIIVKAALAISVNGWGRCIGYAKQKQADMRVFVFLVILDFHFKNIRIQAEAPFMTFGARPQAYYLPLAPLKC